MRIFYNVLGMTPAVQSILMFLGVLSMGIGISFLGPHSFVWRWSG